MNIPLCIASVCDTSPLSSDFSLVQILNGKGLGEFGLPPIGAAKISVLVSTPGSPT